MRTVPRQREVIRGVWNNQLVYAKKFIGSRAQKHFARDLAGVKALIAANIATPPLLFQGETQDGNGFIAIFSAIENAQNAEEVWVSLNVQTRFSLMHRLVQTIALHHQAGLLQTDLYLKNFLVQQTLNQEDLIYTLDGDGIRSIITVISKASKITQLGHAIL